MTDDAAVWLYAVTRGPEPGGLAALSGVAGAPVRAVAAAGLVAVVSSISGAEADEEQLRQNLEDLDWLATTARAHDAVVGAVARSATTVPVRIATIYHDDDRIREMLTEHQAAFSATVDLLTGRTEWGVKAFAASNGSDTSSGEAVSGESAGRAYLLRRRAQLRAREAAEHLAAGHADRVHAELGTLAVAARRHPPQHSRLTGTRASMVLNAAYLVDDTSTDRFAEAVKELDEQRALLDLHLTGPWPPYSFSRIAEVSA